MQLGAAFPADAQAAELVQPGEGSLDDPAHSPEARAVLGGPEGRRSGDARSPFFHGQPETARSSPVKSTIASKHPVGDRPTALPLGHLDRRDHRLDDLPQPTSMVAVRSPRREFARGYANPLSRSQ